MRQFYEVTQAIKDALIGDDNVNTVTLGDAAEIDLAKQNIYPLAHIIPGGVSLDGSTLTMSFDIVFMDVVSDSITDLRDVNDTLHGQNDLQDVWNTQLQVANRLVSRMQRGDLFSDLVQTTDGSLEPFKDEYENLLAGWVLSVDVLAPNNDMCITVNSTELEAPSALTATVTGTVIDLAWTDNSTTEDGFHVLRSTNPLTGYTTLVDVSAGVVAYSDATPVADTFYFYKIQAYNSTVTSGFSNIATQYVASGVAVEYKNSASLIKTGQTTSYATGDDGDLEEGRLASFTTLDFNNVFGNTNRFTDELGGQTYTNDIVIDHSTWVVDTGVILGWFRTQQSAATWTTALTSARALTVGAYSSGWRLPNVRESITLNNFGLSNNFSYGIFSLNLFLWTSTTDPTTTASAFQNQGINQSNFSDVAKSASRAWIACRKFTWSGAALT